jgi:phosphoglycolate phosphatase-like HAD superfamily hydrolase
MRRYDAVLLDVDGTLVDSNDAHAHAWVEALAARGVEASFARVRRMIGMGGDRLVEEITDWSRTSQKVRRLQDQQAKVFAERWLRQVAPIVGTRDLVLRLRQDGYQIALASAAHEDLLRSLLEIAGVTDLIDVTAWPPKPDASKPDPATIEAALSRVDAGRSRAVMIGDTPYDVIAARGADVHVIGFATGGYSVVELAGAVAVYQGPADLLAQWDASPLGSKPARGAP